MNLILTKHAKIHKGNIKPIKGNNETYLTN